MSDFFEYWQLLLILVFFGLGWVVVCVDMCQVVYEFSVLLCFYFQGLNFLFNEQFDKVIDLFFEVVKVDLQMVELYFVFGNLFCWCGEIECVICMYQNLIDCVDFDDVVCLYVLDELGQDYLKVGLFD